MKAKKEKITSLTQWSKKRENNPDFVAAGMMVRLTEELAGIMAEKGWSRSKLAKKLKCSEAYVTKLLRGEQNLTIKKIAQIAGVLHMKPRIVLDGDSHDLILAQEAFTVRHVHGTIYPFTTHFGGTADSSGKTTYDVTPLDPISTKEVVIKYGAISHG